MELSGKLFQLGNMVANVNLAQFVSLYTERYGEFTFRFEPYGALSL